MLCETAYAYGTTIRVWYRKTYYTRMVRTVRVRYVPYAYGMKYAYGTQQGQEEAVCTRVRLQYATSTVSNLHVAEL